MKTFSVEDAIKFGWGKTKEHLWFLSGFFLLVFLLTLGGEGAPGLSFVIGILASISIVSLVLKVQSGGTPTIPDLYANYNQIFSYLIASIMYGAIVVVGLIFLVIPGIYLALRFQFYKYFLIEHNMTPTMALKESARITKGNMWHLLGLCIALALLNVFGFILLGVGLLVTMPITVLASVSVYKKLSA